MGNTCGTLRVHETAVVTTWTDRSIRHGPAAFYAYMPLLNRVEVIPMTEIKVNQYALLEDRRDPSQTRYVYGPSIFRLEHPYQALGAVRDMLRLDHNDYIFVENRQGERRTVVGPMVFRPVYGEQWTATPMEAVNVPVNEYIVVKDTASSEVPFRHLRGPHKFYPTPYEEIVKDPATNRLTWKCAEVTDTQAIYLRRADGKTYLIDRPQFLMPEVGEVVDRIVEKTILKEAEFAIIISPTGEHQLKLGNVPSQRAFFLPPYYTFLQFNMGDTSPTRFTTLPTYISHNFAVRTGDNVQVRLDLRISFTIFQPEMYMAKPVDFYSQIRYWIQNDALDAYAKVPFRDFLRMYADVAIAATANAHKRFNEFGINIEDIQVINFACEDHETERLVQSMIKTNVTKQNELRSTEADVEIMQRKKDVECTRKEIEYHLAEKDNEMAMKRKELDIALRLKDLELEIQEEQRRSELLRARRQNAVMEGEFEGRAQGAAITGFLDVLPTSLDAEHRLSLWHTLRSMERSAMLYSKVREVQLPPPGADVKQIYMSMDEATRAVIDTNPLALPSILTYNAAQGAGAMPAPPTAAITLPSPSLPKGSSGSGARH